MVSVCLDVCTEIEGCCCLCTFDEIFDCCCLNCHVIATKSPPKIYYISTWICDGIYYISPFGYVIFLSAIIYHMLYLVVEIYYISACDYILSAVVTIYRDTATIRSICSPPTNLLSLPLLPVRWLMHHLFAPAHPPPSRSIPLALTTGVMSSAAAQLGQFTCGESCVLFGIWLADWFDGSCANCFLVGSFVQFVGWV